MQTTHTYNTVIQAHYLIHVFHLGTYVNLVFRHINPQKTLSELMNCETTQNLSSPLEKEKKKKVCFQKNIWPKDDIRESFSHLNSCYFYKWNQINFSIRRKHTCEELRNSGRLGGGKEGCGVAKEFLLHLSNKSQGEIRERH